MPQPNGTVAVAEGGGGVSPNAGRVSKPRGRFFPVGIGPVARKELADHLSGLRFGILLVLIVLGTNYLHLAALGGTFLTHPFLFTLYAGVLLSTIRWRERPEW